MTPTQPAGRDTGQGHTKPPHGDEDRKTPGLDRLVRALCALPLVVLDVLAAAGIYSAFAISPRDELDEDALMGIELACLLTVLCAAVSLLLAFLLRRTLSRWWTAPALVLLLAGAARWAYIVHTYPSS